MVSQEELARRFTVVDYVVFAGMLLVSAGIGVFYACTGNKQNTTKDFLFGGKTMKVIPVAISVLATFLSAITLLGIPAETYQFGIQYWMINVSYCFMLPVAACLYMPVFYNLQVSSVNEYLERRFNRTVRCIGFIASTISSLIYMAFVIYAPSLVLSQVTGLHLWLCVLSSGIVCTFYTSTGGIKAVVGTDVFQTIIIFGALLTVVIKGCIEAGGITEVWTKAENSMRTEIFNFDPDPTVRNTFWTLSCGGFFTWLSIYAVNQAMIQRSLTIPSLKGAKQVIWLNLPANIITVTLTTLAGLIIYATYSTCDPIRTKQVTTPNQMLPLFAMDILGFLPGLPGLFVAGIFSGALSSLSSSLNSLAAVTLEDVVRTYIAPNMSDIVATRIAKLLALAYGVIAIIMVVIVQNLPGTVLQAALTINGTFGGPLLGIFSLGMFFPWPNALGVIIGFFSGLAVSLWVCIGAAFNKRQFATAPLSVESCLDLYLNVTNSMNETVVSTATKVPEEEVFSLYRLSYLWYSGVGCLTCIIVGLICCLITGKNDKGTMERNLMSSLFYELWKCGKKCPVQADSTNSAGTHPDVSTNPISGKKERLPEVFTVSKPSLYPLCALEGVYKKRDTECIE